MTSECIVIVTLTLETLSAMCDIAGFKKNTSEKRVHQMYIIDIVVNVN